MKNHVLKCWPEYFKALADGSKPFEARKNDRNFQVGDFVTIHEFDPVALLHTGLKKRFKISYILHGGQFGIEKDYCVLGFKTE